MSTGIVSKIKELEAQLLSLKQEEVKINFALKMLREAGAVQVQPTIPLPVSPVDFGNVTKPRKALSELIIDALSDGKIKTTQEIIAIVLSKQEGLNKESVRTTIKRLATLNQITKPGYSQYQLNHSGTVQR